MFCILFLSGLVASTLLIDLPKYPVRDFATMTMALDPDELEFVRLKIPWGYLAPSLSYLSSDSQHYFFFRARVIMFLMGLSEVDVRKQSIETPREKNNTRAFSFDALYPTFEAKNIDNINQFVSNEEGRKKVINIAVFSSYKSKYWNSYKAGILNSYGVMKENLENALLHSKKIKKFKYKYSELSPQYGLFRFGISEGDVQEMRNNDFREAAIPRDIWENRNNQGELTSYVECMQPDLGLVCSHTMYVANINSQVKLTYHPALLKDWQTIEYGVSQLFKKFIDLGRK